MINSPKAIIHLDRLILNYELIQKKYPNKKFIKLASKHLPFGDKEFDFVSRYFCPKYGINEDPVTGSAHTLLTPYWSERLNKKKFNAFQCSSRGGSLTCQLLNDRVLIGGEESGGIAVTGHIPERDGIWMGLILFEFMAKSGKTLDELINEVYDIVGPFSFERIDLHLDENKKQSMKKKKKKKLKKQKKKKKKQKN